MRQGIIRQKRGSGQEELPYEAWNSQEVEDISVPFVRHMAFDKQSIVNLYEYWLLATIATRPVFIQFVLPPILSG